MFRWLSHVCSSGISLSAGRKMLRHTHTCTQAEENSWWALAVLKLNSPHSACRTQCAEICMGEWKCVPPSYALWILNNIVFSFFSPSARLVLYKKKPLCLQCLVDCLASHNHIKQKGKIVRNHPDSFLEDRLKLRVCGGWTWSLFMGHGSDFHYNIASDR